MHENALSQGEDYNLDNEFYYNCCCKLSSVFACRYKRYSRIYISKLHYCTRSSVIVGNIVEIENLISKTKVLKNSLIKILLILKFCMSQQFRIQHKLSPIYLK
jgi:hypothetical protein